MSSPTSPPVVLNHSPPGQDEDTAINVILPTQSLHLWIHVSPSASVAELKQRIYKNCPGKPLVSGQRVIHKGRVLKDEMIVGELFKPTDGVHNVHLAVHPSAWEEPPPPITNKSTTTPLSSQPTKTTSPPSFMPFSLQANQTPLQAPFLPTPTITQPQGSLVTPSSAQVHIPQQFILHHHTNALRILSRQPPQPWLGPGDFRGAKILTRDVLRSNSRGWPPRGILDSDLYVDYQRLLPWNPNGLEGGVRYEWVTQNNLPYLTLSQTSPDAVPTQIQNRAIDVLTYTFPLLPALSSLPPYSTSSLSPLTSANFGLLHHRDRQRQRIWQAFGEGHNPAQRNPNAQLLERLQQQGFDPRMFGLDADNRGNQPGGLGNIPVRRPAGYPLWVRITLRFYRILIQMILNPSRVIIPIGLVILRACFIVYVFGWTPSPSIYNWVMGRTPTAAERNAADDSSSVWFWIVVAWAIWEIRLILIREAGYQQGLRAGRAAAMAAGRAGGRAALAGRQPDNGNAQNPNGANDAGANAPATPETPAPHFEDHPPGRQAPLARQDQGQPEGRRRVDPLPEPLPAPQLQQFDPVHATLNKLFDYFSKYRLSSEEPQLGLDHPMRPITPGSNNNTALNRALLIQPVNPRLFREPSTLERACAFVLLFFISFVPDIWARRVKLLKVREGIIRTVYGRREWNEQEDEEIIRQGQVEEAGAAAAEAQNAELAENDGGEGATEQEPQQPRRPSQDDVERIRAARRKVLTGWRRDYIRRVIEGVGQEADGM